MVLNPIKGYGASLKVGTDSTEVAGVSNVKLTNKRNMEDITALGDSAVKRYPTIQEWSLTFDLVAFDPTDTGQGVIKTAFESGSSLSIKVYLDSTHYYYGDGFVESMDISIDPKGVIKASVSVQSNGALTYA